MGLFFRTKGLFLLAALPLSTFVFLLIKFELQQIQFILSALALLTGYLITQAFESARGRIDRARQFIGERRADGHVRTASNAISDYELLRFCNGDPISPEISDEDIEALREQLSTMANMYEEMAILIKYGHTDERLLYDYYGNPVVRFFGAFSKHLEYFKRINFIAADGKKITSAPEYIETEWLYRRWLRKYRNWERRNRRYVRRFHPSASK